MRKSLMSVCGLAGMMLVAFLVTTSVKAQPDPQAFRQRMLDRMKEQLGSSDDEWKVLQPKVEKVMDAQRNSRAGMFAGGGRGNRGGGGGGANQDAPDTELGKATKDLRDALADTNTKPEDITKKLEAFRAARDKARADLTAAQKELKEVLNPRQEAVMVVGGYLD